MNTTTSASGPARVALEIDGKQFAAQCAATAKPGQEPPKHMSIITAIRIARTMREEMVSKCGDTVANYVAATDRLIEYITTPSDRELANMYLLVIGATLIALSVVCGAAGVYHAFHGHAEAGIIGLYAAGFFVSGWASLLGVRRR